MTPTHVPAEDVMRILYGRRMTTRQILMSLPSELAKYGNVRVRLRAMERAGLLEKIKDGRVTWWQVKR